MNRALRAQDDGRKRRNVVYTAGSCSPSARPLASIATRHSALHDCDDRQWASGVSSTVSSADLVGESLHGNSSGNPGHYSTEYWVQRSDAARRCCDVIANAQQSMDRALESVTDRAADKNQSYEQLRIRIEHLLKPTTNVLITGMVGRGKSMVANALLGEEWTSSGAEPLTAKPSRAVWGTDRSAAVQDKGVTIGVSVDEAMRLATQAGSNIDVTEIIQYIPHALLRAGVEITDSPGLSDPNKAEYEEIVQKEITAAHVIVIVVMCPPGAESHERVLIESASKYASKLIVVANLTTSQNMRQSRDKDKYVNVIRSMIVTGAERAGVAPDQITVVAVNAMRGTDTKVDDESAREESGLADLENALSEVISREIWQHRLAETRVALAGARREALARARALLATADHSLDMAREMSRLQDLELQISDRADIWTREVQAVGVELANAGAEIFSRPYRKIATLVDSGKAPRGPERSALQHQMIRDAGATWEVLKRKYEAELEQRLGATFLASIEFEDIFLSDFPEMHEVAESVPASPVAGMGMIGAGLALAVPHRHLIRRAHPLLGLALDAVGLLTIADSLIPKQTRDRETMMKKADDMERRGREWAASVTKEMINAVQALTNERLAGITRRREDIELPAINPHDIPLFRTAVERVAVSLEQLDLVN